MSHNRQSCLTCSKVDKALAEQREQIARDIEALRLPVAIGRWEDGSERVDSRAAAHNSGIEQALAVVRGVGEASDREVIEEFCKGRPAEPK